MDVELVGRVAPVELLVAPRLLEPVAGFLCSSKVRWRVSLFLHDYMSRNVACRFRESHRLPIAAETCLCDSTFTGGSCLLDIQSQ